MRSACAIASVMLFILVFDDIDGKKDYRHYNLTIGPKGHEKGKYIYQPSSGGDPKYCRYCPLEAVTNSKYSYKQQPLCNQKYIGKNFSDVLSQYELQNQLIPICNTGEVPVCGPPPEVHKTKNHVMICDPGYSLTNHSVYFSCALVCNISDVVDWQFYCNESRQWEVESKSNSEKCHATDSPVAAEPQDKSQVIGIACGSAAPFIVIIVVVLCCLYRRYKGKKQDKTDQENALRHGIELQDMGQQNNSRRENQNRQGIRNGAIPANNRPRLSPDRRLSIDDSSGDTISNGSSSEHGSSHSRIPNSSIETVDIEPHPENLPFIPPAAADDTHMVDGDMGTRSLGTDTNEDDQDTETCRLLPPSAHSNNSINSRDGEIPNSDMGAVGDDHSRDDQPRSVSSRNTDNTVQKVKPSVSIIQMKDGKKEKSIPLQGEIYTIDSGSHFEVAPNSSGGFAVEEFKVERKDKKRIFMWETYEKRYYVTIASEQDVGLYVWKMKLDNNEEYNGCFEINISPPPLPRVRPSPLGEEAQARNTTNSVVMQTRQPPSTSHLDIESLMQNPHPVNDIIVNNVQIPPEVRGEFVRETETSNDPFRHVEPFSSDMLRSPMNRNEDHIDSGVHSSTGHQSGRSGDLASSRAVSQRHNQIDNNRTGDVRYSTSGYESQASASLARERFAAHFNNGHTLDIASFDERPDRVDDSRMSSEASDIARNLVLGNGVWQPSHDMEELRPDPPGTVSPVHHRESNDSRHQTDRKELYLNNETQQPLPQQQHGVDDGDADSISERIDSVVLDRDFLVNNPEPEEEGVEVNENTYPRAEIQEFPTRNGNDADDNLENHVVDNADDGRDEIEL